MVMLASSSCPSRELRGSPSRAWPMEAAQLGWRRHELRRGAPAVLAHPMQRIDGEDNGSIHEKVSCCFH